MLKYHSVVQVNFKFGRYLVVLAGQRGKRLTKLPIFAALTASFNEKKK